MTISLERTETIATDGTEMASSNELDDMFEQMHIPEGYKLEIVGGTVFMAPQRDVHWQTIRRIVRALEDRFGLDTPVTSDVRIDFPGELNGFAPDVAKLVDGAEKNEFGRWRYQDVEFVAEVISKGTAANDYGPKKTAYARAEVPVYMIADPYLGRCRVFTDPQDGEYKIDATIAYGTPVDLAHTVVGITFSTEEFPRD
ncbi:Uma2 family endonuclease [Streptomyces sioyaensis]|uniref:Uma2 family endonuclease n=1 Tax=Streptomyces sioyaensis TaxID=67364 RepID=UPI00340EA9C1